MSLGAVAGRAWGRMRGYRGGFLMAVTLVMAALLLTNVGRILLILIGALIFLVIAGWLALRILVPSRPSFDGVNPLALTPSQFEAYTVDFLINGGFRKVRRVDGGGGGRTGHRGALIEIEAYAVLE